MKKCGVDGCDKPAIAELLDPSVQDRGYRCRECLEFDIEI